jgi:hypothetical protein
MTPEQTAIRELLANLKPTERLFRINAGKGWTGRATVVKPGVVLIKNARPFSAAPEGWPDLCGWESITITPDMVGVEIAVFKGVEIKKTGRMSDAQKKFRAVLEKMGGIFNIIR